MDEVKTVNKEAEFINNDIHFPLPYDFRKKEDRKAILAAYPIDQEERDDMLLEAYYVTIGNRDELGLMESRQHQSFKELSDWTEAMLDHYEKKVASLQKEVADLRKYQDQQMDNLCEHLRRKLELDHDESMRLKRLEVECNGLYNYARDVRGQLEALMRRTFPRYDDMLNWLERILGPYCYTSPRDLDFSAMDKPRKVKPDKDASSS